MCIESIKSVRLVSPDSDGCEFVLGVTINKMAKG